MSLQPQAIPPSVIPAAPAHAVSRAEVVRIFMYSFSIWLLICICQVTAMRSRTTNQELATDLLIFLLSNLPYPCFCALQYLHFLRKGNGLARGRDVVPALAWASFFFLVVLVFYVPTVRPILLGDKGWGFYFTSIATYSRLLYVFDFLVFLGCFGIVYALAVRRASLIQVQQRELIERENLELKLSLEQQRMTVLQAQLEPHFLFNALNAISALVRADDRRLALTALSQLSMLLRYALMSSKQTYVQVKDEIEFVQDYLALQSLRFSGRLQVQIEGHDERVSACFVPALILQPLVENVVRHDLERHEGPSDVLLRFHVAGQCLHIDISNPDLGELAANPGCGLGISHIRDRLRYYYGAKSGVSTAIKNGRFEVHLHLPIDHDE